MRKNLTPEEIEIRFARVNAQEPEEMTNEESASLKAAEAMDDGFVFALEDLKQALRMAGSQDPNYKLSK